MSTTVTQLDFSQLQQLWTSEGGDASIAPIMAAIALAESGGAMPSQSQVAQAVDGTLPPGSYPGLAYWPNGSAGGGPELSIGPWQVNFINSPQDAIAYSESPQAAASAAVNRYNAQGLSAWSTYNSGAYLQFLNGGSAATDTGYSSGATATNTGFGLHDIPGIGGDLSQVWSGVTTTAGAVSSIFNSASWVNFSINLVGIILIAIGARMVFTDVSNSRQAQGPYQAAQFYLQGAQGTSKKAVRKSRQRSAGEIGPGEAGAEATSVAADVAPEAAGAALLA